MRHRFCLLAALILFIGFYCLTPVFAVDCNDSPPSASNELTDYIASCQQKINQSKQQQQTLQAVLSVLNSKFRLAQAQISQTVNQINSLEKDVDNLTIVVSDLDKSLTGLTQVFLARVRESYMRRGPDPITLFLSSDSFAKFFTTIRYQSIVKSRDQLIISEMKSAKINYDSQKSAKIDKQKQVEVLKSKLLSQQADLKGQQKVKQQLLVDTQNDEKKYAQLRADALAQLAAINKFVANQGGASILQNTTKDDGSWGKYYNQRDSQWGNRPLGSSDISVADAGCLITSMAMVMGHYGKSVTPANIAAQEELFSFADFRLNSLLISGVNTNRSRIAFSKSTAIGKLDEELSANNGKPVIIGIIRYGSSKPEHFLVVKSKDGDDYIINDPFPENGMNIKFKSRYSLSDIATVDRVTVN